MSEITTNVNWLAVGVGAVVAWALGALWYSPILFGMKWAEGVGLKLDSGSNPPVMAMVTQFIGSVLLSWVIGVTAASNALMTTILIVLMLACLLAANGMFAGKSNYAIATESGFVGAMAVVMIVCQGIM